MTDADGALAAPKVRDKTFWVAATALVVGIFVLTLQQTIIKGHGDSEVFFRAAWAAWTGYPLYQVADHHGWSYHYPLTFALLMGPFAEPMPGFARPAWAMPFAVSITIWYWLGVGALVVAVEVFANAIARFSVAAPGFDDVGLHRALRFGPPLLLIAFIGSSWLRGQPTTILILLVVMFLVFLCDRRPLAASLALSLAIAIKMFPAVFLIIPLLRRDARTIAYTLLCSAILLFVLPTLCLGLQATSDSYSVLWSERLRGLASGNFIPRIENELSPWATKMVSVGPMLARAFAAPAAAEPFQLPVWAEYAQYAFDLLLLLLIAAAGYRRFWGPGRPQPDAPYAILLGGAILFAALPAMLPVAEPHYWAQALPLVAMLLFEFWRRIGPVKLKLAALGGMIIATLSFAATGPNAPGILATLGPTTIVMLLPVAWGLIALRRLRDLEDAALRGHG
jgi:glycosyl transferase family 87